MMQRAEVTQEPTGSGPIGDPGRALAAGGAATALVVRADALAGITATPGPLSTTDAWIRDIVGGRHAVLGRAMCPFILPALERGGVYYAPVADCRSRDEVVAVMDALVERFATLPPLAGPEVHLKTLVVIFTDAEAGAVIGAHRELKDRCVARGLMVGEFAPGYRLASTRDAAVNVGESPLPVLALRYMLPSDRRFLEGEDRWMAAWARRFGTHRVPLFQSLTTEQLAAVARLAEERAVAPGDVLCRQGDVGEEFFLILDGSAVIRRGATEVARLGPKDHFGELALLTRERRNATVTAVTAMTLFVLDRGRFAAALDSIPALAHKVLVGLAERVSEADARTARERG